MKIALIQSDIIWEDIHRNLEKFSEKISSLHEKCDLIILPEMFATGFSMQPEKFADFANIQLSWMALQSGTLNAVITGSIIREEKGNFFNSLIWMSPNGNYQIYNKRHLFSFAGEHLHYTPGTENITPIIGRFRIRPLICYDLRFPVWSRNKKEYDVLIYIANWPEIRIDSWRTLLKARALENLCYVVGVNRIGFDVNQISHSGHSCIYDFKGTEILVLEAHKEAVKTIEIDFDSLSIFREKFPAQNDADHFVISNL
jgi:omega-amidase